MPRKGLVDEIIDAFNTKSAFLLYSPPTAGKTSLAQLVMKRFKDIENDVILVGCAESLPEKCFEEILRKTKNKKDLMNNTRSLKNDTLIALDDCHAWFSNEQFLAERRDMVRWMNKTVCFLLVATKLLFQTYSSHLFFAGLPKFTRSKLAFSMETISELIDVLVVNASSSK